MNELPQASEILPVDPVDYEKDVGPTEHHEIIKQIDIDYKADADPERLRHGWRRILRKNPSLEFMQEVALMNQTELDPVRVKKIERKLYWLIVPALLIDFAFYYIDKTTLSYAALFGISTDLHLSGKQYSDLSSMFYIGWIVWAIPGNLLLAKFPLSKYLAVNIFLWGVFLMAQGASQNYGTMVALRIISGAFEAVADPCFIAITSMWFTRKQQPVVIGLWYSANGFGISVGGLFGYGIGQIKSSLAAWRYEFIIIGALCSSWAIAMAFLIPDAPYDTKRFSREDAVIIVSRKRDDYHSVEKRQLKWNQVWETAKDPKPYLFFLFGFSANLPGSGTANFGTLIIKGFGFNTLNTTLLQVPYGIWIAIVIFWAIWVNWKLNHLNIRTYLMAFVTLWTILGFALIIWANGTAAKLAGYYLTGSSNAVSVLCLSLLSGNVGGTTKKLICVALIFMGSAVGAIVGPYTFLASEAPTYFTGIVVCMASRAVEFVCILCLRLTFVIPNKRRDKLFAEGHMEYDPSVQLYDDVTDWENKHFRYVA